MESPVDAIKAKLSIVDVVGSYLKLERAGGNYRARCPFHNEKTPSFFVSPGRETYHCFGCSKGGDIFSFVEELEGVEFKEALRILADRAGVTWTSTTFSSSSQSRLRATLDLAVRFYIANLGHNKVAKDYLLARGLSEESLDKFSVGYAPEGWRNLYDALRKKGISDVDMEDAGLVIKSPKGYYDRFRDRIMFPFFDFSGRPIGFSGRLMPDSKDEGGKYINSPETSLFHKSRVFYGMDKAKQAIRNEDKILLAEGQLDVIMAHQVGTNNCVGVSGTALSDEHVKQIARQTDNLTLVLDSDAAGFRASDRSVRMALGAGLFVSVVELPKGDDPASLIARAPAEWRSALSHEKPFIDYALDYIGKEYPNSREAGEAMREYLYPYLADMYNEIEKDRTMQKVSTKLGVVSDAVRKDYDKWLLTYKKEAEGVRPTKGEQGHSEPNVKNVLPQAINLVARRLWGMLMLLESKSKEVSAYRGSLTSLLEGNYYNLFVELYEGERRGDIIFEAEVYYKDHIAIDQEVKVLFKRLQQEVLKQSFSEAMDELRKSELSGDKERIEKSLDRCQKISIKLNEIQKIKI